MDEFRMKLEGHSVEHIYLRQRSPDDSVNKTVFIARQHTDARYWYSNSVCPSVSDVPISDENGL